MEQQNIPGSGTETDADGSYTLRGLATGSYRIRAQDDQQRYVQEYYNDTLRWDSAHLVKVEGTEAVRDIDFELARGASVSGTVRDADTGSPIADAWLSSGPVGGDHLSWTNTDFDGNFTLSGLPEGVIEIQVQSEGYIEVRKEVRVGQRNLTGLVVELQRGASIAGRVVDAETGAPIAQVAINADRDDGDGPGAWTQTDADGRYVLQGLAPGLYRVKAENSEQGYMFEYFDDRHGGEDADAVRVVGTERVTGVDFGLIQGSSISGTVTDIDTGLPVRNLELGAGPVNRGQVSWTRTDPNGNCTLKGLPQGLMDVEVRGGEYVKQRKTVRVTEKVESGQDFSVQRGASISGRVADGGTGEPIANMDVEARDENGSHITGTRTGSDGEYVLRGIPDRLIEVEVRGQGYVEVRKVVTVRDGQDIANLDF